MTHRNNRSVCGLLRSGPPLGGGAPEPHPRQTASQACHFSVLGSSSCFLQVCVFILPILFQRHCTCSPARAEQSGWRGGGSPPQCEGGTHCLSLFLAPPYMGFWGWNLIAVTYFHSSVASLCSLLSRSLSTPQAVVCHF